MLRMIVIYKCHSIVAPKRIYRDKQVNALIRKSRRIFVLKSHIHFILKYLYNVRKTIEAAYSNDIIFNSNEHC